MPKPKKRKAAVPCSDPKLKGFFPFYLNRTATLLQRRRIQRHLEKCGDCRRDLRFLMALIRTGRKMGERLWE